MPSVDRPHIDGFDAGKTTLPALPVELDEGIERRLMLALAAIISGATPEELAGYLDRGFPAGIGAMLERPGEGDELQAHIRLIVGTLHRPMSVT